MTISQDQPPVDRIEPSKPRMQAVLDRVDDGRVLHIGCVGHDAYHNKEKDWLHGFLHQQTDELVGVDIDEVGILELQQQGYDVRVDDATTLDSVDGPFDTVVAGEVIEHLSDPGNLFATTRDVLARDGELLVTTPNPWAACYVARMALGGDPVGNDEHTCWIDESTMRELARRHGFAGTIKYLQPMSRGLSDTCYRLGHQRLGGTRLFGEFEVVDDE